MPSLQSQVTQLLVDDNTLTIRDMYECFPNNPQSSIRSAYRRGLKVASSDASNGSSGEKITMEKMEGLLIKQLKKKADVATLRLMVDFLKIKQQDQSELQEIDLGMFYKKAMETQ